MDIFGLRLSNRSKLLGNRKRLTYAALSPVIPPILLLRMAVNVMKKRRCTSAFLKALPLTAMLIVSWSLGEFMGYLTASANSPGSPTGEVISQSQND